MKQKTLMLIAVVLLCLGLSGCDRTAPDVSGLGDTVEIDCGTKLNIEEYLNESLKIADETDDGIIDYKLSELEHTVTISDETIYDSETGVIDTSIPGEYQVNLSVKDKSNNKKELAFTLVMNPLKMESTAEELVEMDCGTEFNLLDYLNEHVTITNQAGDVEYSLDEIDHIIDCNESFYDVETGAYNTEKYGENKIALVMAGESVEGKNVVFTVKVNPLTIDSTVEELLEMDCGTPFNVMDYLKENLTITNQAGNTEFQLNDFDYTIDCDESIYNENTGDFDTSKFGEFPVKLTINSESFETNIISFTVKLNPLVIEKGYYVYESGIASSGYEYLGFCEYKNTSSENLTVKSIEFRFFDKDDVMVGSSDMPSYSLDFVKSGASGYALDTFASFNSTISSADEIVRVDVIIDYGKATGEDTTSLEVGEVEITNSYDYNVSGFAGTAIVSNPYDKDVEYYSMLAGMYNTDGVLVGVMDSMTSEGIGAETKARCTAAWLPDSRTIPDQVASVKASARVTSFAGQY